MIFCETKEPLSFSEMSSGDEERAASLPEASLPEGRQENLSEEQREGLPLSAAAPEPSPAGLPDGELPDGGFPDPEEEQGDEDGEDTPTDGGDVPEETEVIGVRFRMTGKNYYFDPCGIVYPEGSHAVVETARGLEYGDVTITNRFVGQGELVMPLRPALRIATPEDDAKFEENRQKEKEALEICTPLFENHEPPMKLIDAEYTFDNSKLLFYFTADGRVDFRELVRDLASIFHCRIELRQMGIRDEAKALGGLGICGRPFCCHAFLPDFVQVSIKMAKEQSLSLNAAKISGACGRLMCCLRYEYDTYLEEGKRTPSVGSTVHTRDGDGIVIEAKPLIGMVKIRPLNDPDAVPAVYPREEVFPGRGDPGSAASDRGRSASAGKKAEEKEREREKDRNESVRERDGEKEKERDKNRSAARKASRVTGKQGEAPSDASDREARSGREARSSGKGPSGGKGGERSRGSDAQSAADSVPEAGKATSAQEKPQSSPQGAERPSRRNRRRQGNRESGGKGAERGFSDGNSPVVTGDDTLRSGNAGNGGEKAEKNERSDRSEKSGKKALKKSGEGGREPSDKEGGRGYTVIPGGEGRNPRQTRRFHGRDHRKKSGKEGGSAGEG